MPEQAIPELQTPIVDRLESTGLFDVKEVGPNTISAISIMGEHERLAGNVLRRMCRLGGEACAQTCVLADGDLDTMKKIMATARSSIDRKCAEENLQGVIHALGVKPENLLIVGVTADGIGFVDEIDKNPKKYGALSKSPLAGVKELPGFNAFFSREGDSINGEEITVIGRRLADCGDVNLEFEDKNGKRVMGFIHMTKPNLQGGDAVKHDYNGKKVGSFEYFLRSAVNHYGADISSVQIRIAAAIKAENFTYVFDEDEKLKQNFPGWEELGLITNKSNPRWKPGESIVGDTLNMGFRGMLEWQMNQVPELKSEQISWEDAIDPGDTQSQHASNARGKKDQDKDGRDAYFTVWTDKLSV